MSFIFLSYSPNPSPSRVVWGEFGTFFEQTFTWIKNLFLYFIQFLQSVPVSSPNGLFAGVSYFDLLVYFSVLFILIRMLFTLVIGGYLPYNGFIPHYHADFDSKKEKLKN